MQFRLFLAVWTLAILLLLAPVVALNLFVDPFGLFNLVEIRGVNAFKSEASHRLRLVKALAIDRVAPQGLILGTSRSNVGLRTTHPGWDPAAQPRYNLSLDAASVHEMLAYLRHAQAVHPLKQVVVGLDFGSFDSKHVQTADFDPRLLHNPDGIWSPLDSIAVDFPLLLGRSAVGASLRTLSEQQRDSSSEGSAKNGNARDALRRALTYLLAPHSEAASKLALNSRSATDRYGRDGQEAGAYFFHNDERFIRLGPQGYFDAAVANAAKLLSAQAADQASGSDSPYADFAALVEFCRAHRIDLRLLIQPAHADYSASVMAAHMWPAYEKWKLRLVTILDQDAARHSGKAPYPLWDFSGFSTLTEEPVPADPKAEYRYFWDPVHYKQDVGDLVLNRIFATNLASVPADFGVQLDTSSINSFLAADRAARDTWIRLHPEKYGRIVASLVAAK